MTELGYTEGKNIVYDVQKTNVDIDAYKKITQKFVQDKVDLIFVFPTEAAMEAKAATQGTNIPVVFDLAFTDVKGIDLINSVREPGGNITGVRFPSVDIASKRLEILTRDGANCETESGCLISKVIRMYRASWMSFARRPEGGSHVN